MISNKDLAPILRQAVEGEILMAGTLLKGISNEEVAWMVIETVHSGEWLRVTLHAYWHNIFMVSKVVRINTITDDIEWGASGV